MSQNILSNYEAYKLSVELDQKYKSHNYFNSIVKAVTNTIYQHILDKQEMDNLSPTSFNYRFMNVVLPIKPELFSDIPEYYELLKNKTIGWKLLEHKLIMVGIGFDDHPYNYLLKVCENQDNQLEFHISFYERSEVSCNLISEVVYNPLSYMYLISSPDLDHRYINHFDHGYTKRSLSFAFEFLMQFHYTVVYLGSTSKFLIFKNLNASSNREKILNMVKEKEITLNYDNPIVINELIHGVYNQGLNDYLSYLEANAPTTTLMSCIQPEHIKLEGHLSNKNRHLLDMKVIPQEHGVETVVRVITSITNNFYSIYAPINDDTLKANDKPYYISQLQLDQTDLLNTIGHNKNRAIVEEFIQNINTSLNSHLHNLFLSMERTKQTTPNDSDILLSKTPIAYYNYIIDDSNKDIIIPIPEKFAELIKCIDYNKYEIYLKTLFMNIIVQTSSQIALLLNNMNINIDMNNNNIILSYKEPLFYTNKSITSMYDAYDLYIDYNQYNGKAVGGDALESYDFISKVISIIYEEIKTSEHYHYADDVIDALQKHGEIRKLVLNNKTFAMGMNGLLDILQFNINPIIQNMDEFGQINLNTLFASSSKYNNYPEAINHSLLYYISKNLKLYSIEELFYKLDNKQLKLIMKFVLNEQNQLEVLFKLI